jgi:hypothetical protein
VPKSAPCLQIGDFSRHAPSFRTPQAQPQGRDDRQRPQRRNTAPGQQINFSGVLSRLYGIVRKGREDAAWTCYYKFARRSTDLSGAAARWRAVFMTAVGDPPESTGVRGRAPAACATGARVAHNLRAFRLQLCQRPSSYLPAASRGLLHYFFAGKRQ